MKHYLFEIAIDGCIQKSMLLSEDLTAWPEAEKETAHYLPNLSREELEYFSSMDGLYLRTPEGREITATRIPLLVK